MMEQPLIIQQLFEKFGKLFEHRLVEAIMYARHYKTYFLFRIVNNNLKVVGIGNDYATAKADAVKLAEEKVPHIFVGPQFLIIGPVANDAIVTTATTAIVTR